MQPFKNIKICVHSRNSFKLIQKITNQMTSMKNIDLQKLILIIIKLIIVIGEMLSHKNQMFFSVSKTQTRIVKLYIYK